MTHPDFKHRASPDVPYEEFLPIDLLAFIKTKVDFIDSKAHFVAGELSLPVDERRTDKDNIITLSGLRDDALDIGVLIEWFLENFECNRIQTDEAETE